MTPLLRHMLITTALLTIFVVVGTSIVALTQQNTHEIIAENQRQELLRTLNELVPPERYDNDPAQDQIAVRSREYLGTKKDVTVYRARRGETPVAAIMTPVAPDGYSGDIGLLVAIDSESGNLLGVRVLWHKETPGLGDWIETEKSDWIHSFTGHSLSDPDELGWRVEKDGGIFDQVTGATITPRAIVKAVYNTLKYYDHHQTELFHTARAPADAIVPPGSDEPQRSGEPAAAEDEPHEPG